MHIIDLSTGSVIKHTLKDLVYFEVLQNMLRILRAISLQVEFLINHVINKMITKLFVYQIPISNTYF